MAKKIASLVIELGANSAKLDRAFNKAKRKSRSFSQDIAKGAKIGAIGLSAMGVAGVAALSKIVSASFEVNDSLAKTADKIGVTTKALAGLRLAGELTGVANSKVDMSLQRMVRRLSEAAKGTGEAKDAIKELGLDAQKLVQLKPDEAFQEIAGAMGNVSNQSDRVRLAFKLFDSEGVALVNTLKLGKQGLKDVAAEAEVLGIAISRVDASKMEASNDALTRAKKVADGVGNTIAIKLAPIIEAIANSFVDSAKEAKGFGDTVDNAFDGVVSAVGFVLDAVHGVKVAFAGVQTIALSVAAGIGNAFGAIAQATSNLFDDTVNSIRESLLESLNDVSTISQALNEYYLISDEKNRFTQRAINNIKASLNSEVDTQPTAVLAGIDIINEKATAAVERLKELASEPLPSEGLKRWVAQVEEAAQEAAEKRTAILNQDAANDADFVSKTEQKLQREFEVLERYLASGLDARAQSRLAQEEAEIAAYQRRQDIANEYFDSLEVPEEQRRQKVLEQLRERHEKTLTKIKQSEEQHRLQTANQFFGALASLSQAGSKKLFKVAKAAAIAQTVVNTYAAAQRAMAEISYPANIAVAAAAVVAGLARVKQIKSTEYGGSSSASPVSVSTSGAAATSSPVSSPAQVQPQSTQESVTPQLNITILGDVNGVDEDAFIENLSNKINNEDIVLIQPGSRNGIELAAAGG